MDSGLVTKYIRLISRLSRKRNLVRESNDNNDRQRISDAITTVTVSEREMTEKRGRIFPWEMSGGERSMDKRPYLFWSRSSPTVEAFLPLALFFSSVCQKAGLGLGMHRALVSPG